MLRTADFSFSIPGSQIAKRPRPHDEHRLLAYQRDANRITHSPFDEITQALPPDSLIVINNSKVVNAALKRQPDDGTYIQILNPREVELDQTIIRRVADAVAGSEIPVAGGHFMVRSVGEGVMLGSLMPNDPTNSTLPLFLENYGVIPLPDYIASERLVDELDASAFNVHYAHVPGSLTCPTAGLHFYPELMASIEEQGHQFVEVTLHIGYGSWGSLNTTYLDEFDLDSEEIIVEIDSLRALWRGKQDGRPIVAVGTTCVRTLESIAPEVLQPAEPEAGVHRTTNMFIRPPYQPRVADALLTDFAYPQTPVMAMTAVFCGLEPIQRLYQEALKSGYMFDIFGDALLIR